MTFLKTVVLLLAMAVISTACKEEAQQVSAPVTNEPDIFPQQAQPKLPTTRLYMGEADVTAEVAMTDETRMTGLMHRTTMGENEGMLFVFPAPHQTSFWMKNTILPLSIAYIDPQGVILEIHDLEPGNTNGVTAKALNVQFALEMNRGWFARHKIEPGTFIQTDRGPLPNTFSGLR